MAAYARPITVNLQVTADASQNVDILGGIAGVASNPVVCAVTMPVKSFYSDLSHALFEIWEPSAFRGTLSGTVAGGTMGVDLSCNELSGNFHACLTGSLEASGASPFSGYKAVGIAEYYTFDNIGELALGYAAHVLFGHTAATAAITNDLVIVTNMNARTGTGAKNIATALTDKILALNASQAETIARVVIGQDSARARDEDNNQLQTDQHIALKFYAGDKIIVSVHLKDWTRSNGEGQTFTTPTLPDQLFDFIITLA
jgi:hypothetical protein